MTSPFQVVFDCADPARVGQFWATALGYVVPEPPEGYANWREALSAMGVPEERWDAAYAIEDPAGVQPRVYFQRVPEGKTVKNRVHLDINASGGWTTPLDERRFRVDARVSELEAAGATLVRRTEEHGHYYVVLTDPEGNEFCVH